MLVPPEISSKKIMKLRIANTSVLDSIISEPSPRRQSYTRYFLFIFASFIFSTGFAQVSITQLGTPYTENFNGMGKTIGANLPAGFVTGGDWTTGITLTSQIAGSVAGAGTVLSISSPVGVYNFGNGQNDTANDRSAGFVYGTTYKAPRSILYGFINNTSSPITQIKVAWKYEKYKSGQVAHACYFYHGGSITPISISVPTGAAIGYPIVVSSAVGILPGMSVSLTSGTGALSPNTIVSTVGIPTANTISLSQPITTALGNNSIVTFRSTATIAADSVKYAADLNNSTIYYPSIDSSRVVNIDLTNTPIGIGSTYYLRWMIGPLNTTNAPAIGLDSVSITYGDGRCYPYTQARVDSITVGPSNSLNVNYTRGNGNRVLIVASTSATPTAPTNGTTYTASTTFGSGSALGSGSVVYDGTGNGTNAAHSVNVTNLNSSTPYYFYIYEYNTAGNCYHPAVVSGNGYFSGASDYFRSRASGNWNLPSTWESSKDNTTWVSSTIKPDSTSKGITIRMPDSVAIAGTETAKNLAVNSGATLSYNTAVASAGSIITIANDLANEFDFNISGRYIVYGNPATLVIGAKVKVNSGGLVLAEKNNSPSNADNFPGDSSVLFSTGSVFQWNAPTSPQSRKMVYFNYKNSQPFNEIPTFLFTVNTALGAGAGNNTTFNGKVEVNSTATFQNAGIKYFRNGIIGSGVLSQNSTSGQFIITGPAILGGTGTISLSTAGLRIADTAITTLLSNKPINGSFAQLDGTLYTSTNAITGTTAFTVSPTAKLYIGSPNGITASAASGNIQCIGTRTYNSAAAYHYNGTSSQVTGDGLPANITGSLNISNTGSAGNNIVTLTTSGTTASTFNLNSGLFAAGISGILNIAGSGTINGNGGNVTNSTDGGTINFNGSGTVSGSAASVSFYIVTTSGAVNFGAAINSIINNLFQINIGGSVNTNPPSYVTGSLLKYNTGGTFTRGAEFSATAGKGYPHHVQLSNNTLLDMGSTTPAVSRQMAGNLTIDAGSTFSLNNGTNDMTVPVAVKGNLELNGTLTLSDLAGGDLQLAGNWNRTATGIFNPNERIVFFNGSSNSTTISAAGGQYFSSLYVTKAAKINSVKLLDSVAVGKELQIVTGTLDLGAKDLVLLSNINTTASLGKIDANNADIAYSGTGRFIVERYIRTGPTNLATGQHGKTWQHLAIPTRESLVASGQTIRQSWQEDAPTANANPRPGYGTQLIGYGTAAQLATAISNGFDTISAAGATIKTYNPTTGLWDYVSNTRNTALYDKRGYMVFVRGDRGVTQYSATNNATPTILRSRGKLLSPPMPPDTVVIPAGKMVSIGNPYASAIDFTLFNFSLNDSQIYSADSLKYWIWDPTLTGSYGLGGYQALSGVNDFYLTAPSGNTSANYTVGQRYTRIESGQAFLMKSYSNSSFRFEINEDAKVSDSRNVFRTTGALPSTNTAKQFLRMYLFAGTGEGALMADGVAAVFSPNYTNRFDGFDMEKLANAGENLSIRCASKSLSVEARSPVIRTDSVYLNTTNLRARTYELRFAPQQIPANGIGIGLFDKYLNSVTPLSTGDSSYYTFVVNTDPLSYRSDRFVVVFSNTQRTSQSVPKPLVETAKNQQVIESPSPAKLSIQTNPVTNGIIKLQLLHFNAGKYAYSIIGIAGQIIQSGEMNVQNSIEYQSIKLNNMVKGQYKLVVAEKNGKLKQTLSVFIGL